MTCENSVRRYDRSYDASGAFFFFLSHIELEIFRLCQFVQVLGEGFGLLILCCLFLFLLELSNVVIEICAALTGYRVHSSKCRERNPIFGALRTFSSIVAFARFILELLLVRCLYALFVLIILV